MQFLYLLLGYLSSTAVDFQFIKKYKAEIEELKIENEKLKGGLNE